MDGIPKKLFQLSPKETGSSRTTLDTIAAEKKTKLRAEITRLEELNPTDPNTKAAIHHQKEILKKVLRGVDHNDMKKRTLEEMKKNYDWKVELNNPQIKITVERRQNLLNNIRGCDAAAAFLKTIGLPG